MENNDFNGQNMYTTLTSIPWQHVNFPSGNGGLAMFTLMFIIVY